MTAFELPTTIGSIVEFSFTDAGDTLRMVATLAPGSIRAGEASHVRWIDAFCEGEEDSIHDVEKILAGDPEILFEAAENSTFEPLRRFDVAEDMAFGTVVSYESDWAEDERFVAVYTPGIVNSRTGELQEAAWINSYGLYVSTAELENSEAEVLVIGSDEL